MLLSGKRAQDVTEKDLLDLIEYASEDIHLDFKSDAYQVPSDTEISKSEKKKVKEKKKFDLLDDLVAFSNAQGGWIICGMREKGGVPTDLIGLDKSLNIEGQRQHLEKIAMAGIEPPILGLEFVEVRLSDPDKGSVILIRIPNSVNKPHRVKETKRFCVRRSGRNDDMNMDELRAAFDLSFSLVERTRKFRADRVEILNNLRTELPFGNFPTDLSGGIGVVLHVMPSNWASATENIDLSTISDSQCIRGIPNGSRVTDGGTFDLDGFWSKFSFGEQDERFVEIFRNRIIESIVIQKLRPQQSASLPSIYKTLTDQLRFVIQIQQCLLIEPPFAAFVSIIGCRNREFHPNGYRSLPPPTTIRRVDLRLPEFIVRDTSLSPKDLLKPAMDVLWNAAGYKDSTV